ncbi:hypothetical protein [Vibrio scophthalmi]|uniref:Uncharacterized protein n=1 Tax=Vibrio scophthalmi LMG 19158 TaxID=870967 RepID=F9RNR4_9VIBR|nr:hypothetical protein [Vibrio scophthalmi]EGU36841.1 hypothetical protein VIS19158_22432 [Vibrio scophthalmi LMG 19158]
MHGIKNQHIAIHNIQQLKIRSKHKYLAMTAEFVLSVNAFTYQDLSVRFNINCRAAAARIKRLKSKGFRFNTIGLNHAEGRLFRLVDCEIWQDDVKPKGRNTKIRPTQPSFVFVSKASPPVPELDYLWKVALGL